MPHDFDDTTRKIDDLFSPSHDINFEFDISLLARRYWVDMSPYAIAIFLAVYAMLDSRHGNICMYNYILGHYYWQMQYFAPYYIWYIAL